MSSDGSGFQPSWDLEGRQIGRYLVQARLGSGGVATVYQAYDQVAGRSVALKVLSPTADPNTLSRFRHEALTAGALKHDHIVRIYQVGTALEGDVAYIAMELVEGDSLADWLARLGRLRPEESCNLLEPIARAMGVAHRAGVIHRDIKPSNILLRPSTPGAVGSVQLESADFPVVPLLADFGVARSLDAPELTSEGRTVGTPAYMAPEQCAGNRVIDGRADIYSLCTVLYRSVVGRLPFSGTTTQILHAHVYAPLTIDNEILRQLPPNVVDIMRKGLAKAPEDRYVDADALADDLARAAGRRIPPQPNSVDGDRTVSTTTATLTLSANVPPAGRVEAASASPAQSILVPAVGVSKPSVPITGGARRVVPPALEAPPSQPLAQRLEQFNWIGYGLSALIVLTLVFGVILSVLYLPKLLDGIQSDSSSGDAMALGLVAPTPTATPSGQLTGLFAIGTTPVAAEPAVAVPAVAVPALADVLVPVVATAPNEPEEAQATETVAPSPTPVPPEPTPTPVPPFATSTPLPPLPVTPLVTLTTEPITEQVFTCPNVVDPAFFQYIAGMADNGPGFRCPNSGGNHTRGNLLRFEHGFMLQLADDPALYIYYETNQEWEWAASSWREGDPAKTGEFEPPAPYLYQPENQFGQLWADPHRQISLGFATTDQPAPFEAVQQTFPGGVLIGDESNGFVYLFLRDKLRL